MLEGNPMNEYSRIRNEHDRAVILAELVKADAMVVAAAMRLAVWGDASRIAGEHLDQSRAELWKLIGPAPEGEAQP